MSHLQVTTTVDSRETADALARTAVEARFAACAQVSGPLTSTYRWRGAIETSEEWQIVFKTSADRYDALAGHIRDGHPYDVPETVAVPIVAGDAAYLEWVTAETHP